MARSQRGLLSTVGMALLGCAMLSCSPLSFGSPTTANTAHHLPRPAHVVIVWEENKAYGDIIGNPKAPYINHLAHQGLLMTRAYGVTHPSEPNYLAFFSGSTHALHDDGCPYRFSGPNLAASLSAAGRTFTLYAQGLPHERYAGCNIGAYARKHNAVADYPALPQAATQPFTRFPHDFAHLPTLAWVIPDLRHDMHSGAVRAGDRWLKRHIQPFVTWAQTHNSLLIVAWDEDDYAHHNHIPVILVGPMVRHGKDDQLVSHFDVLRTLEMLYGLAPIGRSVSAMPITGIWQQ